MVAQDRSRIEQLAADVQAKMVAKAAWLAETEGEFVVRITPPKDGSGSYKIRLEAKA